MEPQNQSTQTTDERNKVCIDNLRCVCGGSLMPEIDYVVCGKCGQVYRSDNDGPDESEA